VEFIEKYWCPTLTSDQVLGGRPLRFAADHRQAESVASPAIVKRLSGRPCTAEAEQVLRRAYPSYRNADPDYRHAGPEALDRWMDWKWGLRIHWGLYCMYEGRDASWVIQEHLNDKQWQKNYYASYQEFNPVKFDADQWMQIMKRAGMKYFSFTSKHHEGFCMWPTKTLQRGLRKKADGSFEAVTDHFSIAETPFRRDIVGELVKAGRAHGLGVSLYYSHIDWHDWDFGWDKCNLWYDGKFRKPVDDPSRWAAFIQKERDQISELLTWYGPIDTLCLDIAWPREAQHDAYDVAKLARRLQPNIMLRNRGIGDYGDYETPEGKIPEDPSRVKRPWQVIYPCGSGFSYKSHDHYKSKEWVLESLIDIVAKGGNFQVGFGPRPDGTWPSEMTERLAYVGDWLKVNGECIYATRPFRRWHEGKEVRFTRSKDGRYVYAICLKWPGAMFRSQLVAPKPGSAVRMLGADQDLKWRCSDQEGLVVEIPESLAAHKPCAQAYSFRMEVAGNTLLPRKQE
jgi:alpha-L-fucosidase